MIFIRRKEKKVQTEKFYRTTVSLEKSTLKRFKEIANKLDIQPAVLIRQVIYSWATDYYAPVLNYIPDRHRRPTPKQNNLCFNVNRKDLAYIRHLTNKHHEITNFNRFCRALVETFVWDFEEGKITYVPASFRE